MESWWCVRHGDALAWVEAPSALQALRHPLDLHPLGDWTDDARQLVVFPQGGYPDHAGPHDYTRVVLNAEPPPRSRRRARLTKLRSRVALGSLATAVMVLGLVNVASAETWRGLTVAPEHRCVRHGGETLPCRTQISRRSGLPSVGARVPAQRKHRP